MIVVDSSVWIDYFNGMDTRETTLLDRLLGSEPVLTGDLILAEILQGFADDREFHRARRALDTLVCEPMAGSDIALASARNLRTLRARGVSPRKTVAMLIATFCMENGHHLLHADPDFDAIEAELGLWTV